MPAPARCMRTQAGSAGRRHAHHSPPPSPPSLAGRPGAPLAVSRRSSALPAAGSGPPHRYTVTESVMKIWVIEAARSAWGRAEEPPDARAGPCPRRTGRGSAGRRVPQRQTRMSRIVTSRDVSFEIKKGDSRENVVGAPEATLAARLSQSLNQFTLVSFHESAPRRTRHACRRARRRGPPAPWVCHGLSVPQGRTRPPRLVRLPEKLGPSEVSSE